MAAGHAVATGNNHMDVIDEGQLVLGCRARSVSNTKQSKAVVGPRALHSGN